MADFLIKSMKEFFRGTFNFFSGRIWKHFWQENKIMEIKVEEIFDFLLEETEKLVKVYVTFHRIP